MIPGSWDAVPITTAKVNADQKDPEPLVVDLGREDGLYGLTLIAKSGVDFGLPAPTGNDAPQMTVRLIRTPPKVTVSDVQVGRGPNAGRVNITWQASQKDNLMGRQCITISVLGRDGRWQPVHTGKLDNVGQYIWVLPTQYDPKLSFKVEAEDWAHNVGSATKDDVILDLSTPRVIPHSIEVQP